MGRSATAQQHYLDQFLQLSARVGRLPSGSACADAATGVGSALLPPPLPPPLPLPGVDVCDVVVEFDGAVYGCGGSGSGDVDGKWAALESVLR
eukprot:365066-Chlamydomonas_euryale.AAC.12